MTRPLKVFGDPERWVDPPDRQLPPEEQTVWLLAPLSLQERWHLENGSTALDANGRLYTRSGFTQECLLRFGVRGVENFGGVEWSGEPSPIAGGRQVAAVAFLEKIPQGTLARMAKRIDLLSTLAEDDRGKPTQSPDSSSAGTGPSAGGTAAVEVTPKGSA